MPKSFAGFSRVFAFARVVRVAAVAATFVAAATVVTSAPLSAQDAGAPTAAALAQWVTVVPMAQTMPHDAADPGADELARRVASGTEARTVEGRGMEARATPSVPSVSDMSLVSHAAMAARIGVAHTADAPVPAPRQRNDATLRQNLAMIGVGVTALVLSGVVDDDGVRVPLAIGGAGLTLWGVYRILR